MDHLDLPELLYVDFILDIFVLFVYQGFQNDA